MQKALRQRFETTQEAIRFLRVVDDEQIEAASVVLRPATDDGPAPPEQDPRPAGESRVIGSDSDRRDALDGLGDSDEAGDSGNSLPSSGESADRSDGSGSRTNRSGELPRTPPNDPNIPKATHSGEDSRNRYLRPGGAYHHTLYLVAVHEHETSEGATSTGLYDYFEDEYDRLEQVSPLLSVLHNDFDRLDRDTVTTDEGSWAYKYRVNDAGIEYLRQYGYPTVGNYAVSEKHQYDVNGEIDDG